MAEVRRIWTMGLRQRVEMHRGVQVALYGVGLLCRFVRFDLPDDGPVVGTGGGQGPSEEGQGVGTPVKSAVGRGGDGAAPSSAGAGIKLASRLGLGDGGDAGREEDPIGDEEQYEDEEEDEDEGSGGEGEGSRGAAPGGQSPMHGGADGRPGRIAGASSR